MCYSHVNLAEVAVAVLDDVSMFGAVEHGDRTSVTLCPDIVVGRVDGHGHHVDTQVTDEHDACTLFTDQDSHTNVGGLLDHCSIFYFLISKVCLFIKLLISHCFNFLSCS